MWFLDFEIFYLLFFHYYFCLNFFFNNQSTNKQTNKQPNKNRYFGFTGQFLERSNMQQLAFDALLVIFVLYVIFKKPAAKPEKPLSTKVWKKWLFEKDKKEKEYDFRKKKKKKVLHLTGSRIFIHEVFEPTDVR